MRILYRSFHVARTLWRPPVAVEKSQLAKLRKATGYSFSKCKEALQKHENDLKLAEEWLKTEAQAHGWQKATKLQGRATAQGLVSILSSPTNTVMLETNCETDFVARNKKFQTLVQKITQGSFQFSNEQNVGSAIAKVLLSGDELSNLPVSEARSVKDEIALSIGELGENIKTRRAVCLKSSGPVILAGYTHPPPDGLIGSDVVQFGKYGALVAFKSTGSESLSQESSTLIGRQLCQHIVGMNPKEIGSLEEPPAAAAAVRASEPPVPAVSHQSPEDHSITTEKSESEDEDVQFSKSEEVDEATLVNQEFLLDPDMTVREFLIQNSVEVVDFVRYECGEAIATTYCE